MYFLRIMNKKLIGIDSTDGFMSLNGFVGGLDLVRKKSGEQYLFVNNRLVNDRSDEFRGLCGLFTHGGQKGSTPSLF